jgi:hypothetical protein
MSDHLRKWDRWTTEPVFHIYTPDSLSDDDPRSWESIYCTDCQLLVHSRPNQCMDNWADTEFGALCLVCLTNKLDQL